LTIPHRVSASSDHAERANVVMKILAIALNTFREAIRNQILYSILFFAVLVVALSAIFGAASIGDQMKFIKDFSLMSISLFGVIIAIVLGVNLLQKELSRRTIFNILSKPVTRAEFVVGKFLGLLGTLGLIVALMCGALTLVMAAFEGHVDGGLLLASFTTLLELTIIIAFSLFFSSIVVTPTLAGLFSAAAFIAGRSAGYLHFILHGQYSDTTKKVATSVYWLLPHLHKFNIADQVVYGDRIDPSYLAALVVYALCYSGLLLLLSMFLFSRREFAQ
jgi:Cu-processing system permease protein